MNRRKNLRLAHKRHRNAFHKKNNFAIPLKILLQLAGVIIAFIFSYKYYLSNKINAFFTTLIALPFVDKVVEGWVYWIIILVILILIWKFFDYLFNQLS